MKKRIKKVKKNKSNFDKKKVKEIKSLGRVQLSLLFVMILLSMALVFFNMN
mgnify:CR=1 FL=1